MSMTQPEPDILIGLYVHAEMELGRASDEEIAEIKARQKHDEE